MQAQMTETTQEVLDDLHNRCLSFHIGDALYGILLSEVIEIIQIQKITVIPNVPMHVKGLINLRGKVMPVLNTRLKMGKPELPYDDKTCIIVAVIRDMQIGLIVDSVSEVITIDPNTVATPPKTGNENNQYFSCVVTHNDESILNIDLGRFLATDLSEF